jgi:hypothetical protein
MFWKPDQTGQRKQKERSLARKRHPQTAARAPANSNRETRLLEIAVTARKHSLAARSNRDKNRFFTATPAPPPQPDAGRARAHPVRGATEKNSPTRRKCEYHPSFMFRLKGGPIVYFHELTTSFNRTMFRLKRFCSTATPGCVGRRRWLDAERKETKSHSQEWLCYWGRKAGGTKRQARPYFRARRSAMSILCCSSSASRPASVRSSGWECFQS